MTNKSKMVMIASSALALGIIISSIPLVKTAFTGETVNIQILVFSIAIMLLGITSVIGVYYSKVKKSNIEAQLNGEFYEGYEIIKEIISTSQLDGYTIKEIKEDVLDMLISAQSDGKKFKEVVGEPQKFGVEILEQYGKAPKYNFMFFLDSVTYMVVFLLGVTAVLWIEDIDRSFFDVKIDYGMFAFFLIISFVIVPYLRINSISKNPKLIFLPIGIGILYVAFSEVLRRFLYDIQLVKKFLDGSVSVIPSQIVLIVFILVLVGLIVCKRKSRKRIKVSR